MGQGNFIAASGSGSGSGGGGCLANACVAGLGGSGKNGKKPGKHFSSLEAMSAFERWATALWSELDYQREARAQDAFCKRFSGFLDSTASLQVPTLIKEATWGRFLTTRWTQGL